MIDTAKTMERFGYDDCGGKKPVMATCPVCGETRKTTKRCADVPCRACARKTIKRQCAHIKILGKEWWAPGGII